MFAYHVDDPQRYGVVDFDKVTGQALTIEEKPTNAESNWAVTGLYFYDNDVVISPRPSGPPHAANSKSQCQQYLSRARRFAVQQLGRGYAWLDTGTHDSLHEASSFVRTIELRQGIKIACPEEIGLEWGWLSSEQVRAKRIRIG